MSNIQVKDAVVFITGANRQRGIGRALVNEAVKRGAKKVYATTRDMSQLDELVAEHKGIVVPLCLDVTNEQQIKEVAKEASDTQILINNSGVANFAGICFKHNREAARREFEVNFWGPMSLIQAFTSSLIKNKDSAVVNVISIGGLSSFPLSATYCASKAAFHSMTQAVRAELSLQGVAVFGVYPGPIETDMTDGFKHATGSTAVLAKRTFDGIAEGIEDITTDDFSDMFMVNLKKDAKAVEKNVGDFVHKRPAQ